MRRLTPQLMNDLGVSETDTFISDVDGTANPAGGYTCNFYQYLDPHTRDTTNCVIKRVITNNTTGDNFITYAEGTRQGSLELQNNWANRTSLTYKALQV